MILFIIFVIQINLFIRQSKIHALVKVHIKNTNRQLFRNFNRFQQRFRISFGYPFVEITYIQLFIKMYRIIIPYFSDSSFTRISQTVLLKGADPYLRFDIAANSYAAPQIANQVNRKATRILQYTLFQYACYECFYPLCPYPLLRSYARFCQTSAKEKRCNPQKKITTLSKPYSILTDTSYLPSVSTSAISFAVALTIRMHVSLKPSRSASSCRRCVFFSGGVSKRNWSTDIL